MKWTISIGRIRETEIQLHLTLILVVIYVLVVGQPGSVGTALWTIGTILALFACIFLHELGHTLVSWAYGIKVSSIILWPLGGFAVLERQPEKPLASMLIAGVGPLVNLVLAGLVLVVLFSGSLFQFLPEINLRSPLGGFLAILVIMNGILALFNLFPIYPLDGGRVLHALFQMVMGAERADTAMLIITLPLIFVMAVYAILSGEFLLLLTSLLLLMGASTLNLKLRRWVSLAFTALTNRGSYCLLRRDYDKAITHYSRSIKRWPWNINLYFTRGIAYLVIQEIDKAQEDAEMAFKLAPENPLAWILKGEIYEANDDLEQALASYQRAAELKPGWYLPYADCAGVHMARGDFSKALADLEQSFKLNPRSDLVHVLRSMVRYRLGDLDGSQKDGEKAIKLLPENSLVFPGPFLVLMKDQVDWAEGYYHQAMQMLPNSSLPHQGLADAYGVNGEYEKALIEWDLAIQKSPKRAALFLGRGSAYLQLGEREQAGAEFRKVLSLSKKAHIRRQTEVQLQALAEET